MERRHLCHYRNSVKNCFLVQNFTEIMKKIPIQASLQYVQFYAVVAWVGPTDAVTGTSET